MFTPEWPWLIPDYKTNRSTLHREEEREHPNQQQAPPQPTIVVAGVLTTVKKKREEDRGKRRLGVEWLRSTKNQSDAPFDFVELATNWNEKLENGGAGWCARGGFMATSASWTLRRFVPCTPHGLIHFIVSNALFFFQINIAYLVRFLFFSIVTKLTKWNILVYDIRTNNVILGFLCFL